jgi:hypothetical protein
MKMRFGKLMLHSPLRNLAQVSALTIAALGASLAYSPAQALTLSNLGFTDGVAITGTYNPVAGNTFGVSFTPRINETTTVDVATNVFSGLEGGGVLQPMVQGMTDPITFTFAGLAPAPAQAFYTIGTDLTLTIGLAGPSQTKILIPALSRWFVTPTLGGGISVEFFEFPDANGDSVPDAVGTVTTNGVVYRVVADPLYDGFNTFDDGDLSFSGPFNIGLGTYNGNVTVSSSQVPEPSNVLSLLAISGLALTLARKSKSC